MKLSIFNMHRPPESPAAGLSGGNRSATQQAAVGNPPSAMPSHPDCLRDEALQWLMAATTIIASLVYLLGLKEMVQQGRTVELIGFGLAIFCLFGLVLAKKISFPLRAAAFFIISMGLGVAALADKWLAGDGRVTLLVIPLLTLFLLAKGRFVRWFRSAAIVLCLGIIGLAAGQAYPQALTTGFALTSWLSAGLAFGLIALVVTLAIDRYLRSLSRGLSASLGKQEMLELERERSVKQAAKNSHDLERRLNQIRTVAEINSDIGSLRDLETLLPQVCELVKERFSFYYVGLFLVDADKDEAVLKAGTGEAGSKMLAAGHILKVGGESMIGWATANRKARIALDIDELGTNPNIARFNNPHLPHTRSELALPILGKQAVLGAMTIQSEQEAAFDQDDIVVLQSVADSLASAIENARLFADQQSHLDEISTLHRQYIRHSWVQAFAGGAAREYLFDAHPAQTAAPEEGSPLPSQQMEIPIQLRGQDLGSLMLETPLERALSLEEQNLIQAVINQTALALENARLLDETRQRADQETITANISAKIWSTTNIDTILSTALQELSRSLGIEEGSIELWPEPQPADAIPVIAGMPNAWAGTN